MIDFEYASKTLMNHKLDYDAYLIIINKIRLLDLIQTKKLDKLNELYVSLTQEYKKEIDVLQKKEKSVLLKKNTRKNLLLNSKALYNILPAIAFVRIGIGNEIGFNY